MNDEGEDLDEIVAWPPPAEPRDRDSVSLRLLREERAARQDGVDRLERRAQQSRRDAEELDEKAREGLADLALVDRDIRALELMYDRWAEAEAEAE